MHGDKIPVKGKNLETEQSAHTVVLAMPTSSYGYGDPYSKNLSRFFKGIAISDPLQPKLLNEYTKYPELRPYIHVNKDPSNGDILGFKITNDSKYKETKEDLKLSF